MDRLDGELHVAPGGHDHHGQRLIESVDLRQQIQPFASGGRVARVVEIHQEEIEILGFEGLDHRPRRDGGVDLVPLPLEQEAERLQDVRFVVSDQGARDPRPRHIRRDRGVPTVQAHAASYSYLSAVLGSTRVARRAGM